MINSSSSKKLYIIAGEASGDLHGSNLIKQLKAIDNNIDIRCWGGDKMQAAGGSLVKHYKDLAFMGFIEVLKNLPTILKNIRFCKEDILAYQPDAVVLVDYPGFNLRIAKWAKQQGIKVIYYISPQVWAWKENRVKMMKQCIDKMICILPFEKDYYKQKWNWEVEYVGHPLVEVVEDFKTSIPSPLNTYHLPIIALLPGSRKQEILTKLPIMLSVVSHFPNYQFIIAKAPGLDEDFYNNLIATYPNVSWVVNETYALLSKAKAALVTSGTATLETALFEVPQIICYKGSVISYQIAKRLISIKFIGLVNLIMNKEVVKELIQHELNTNNLVAELSLLLNNTQKQQQINTDYSNLKKLLKLGGNASKNAADSIYLFLQ
ncbi:MAG: lipid-A-disaccharide synthase [Ferruginibacter sp.]|nr:lipid-A-disaccharide synthase [Ferruginibacter sp.]